MKTGNSAALVFIPICAGAALAWFFMDKEIIKDIFLPYESEYFDEQSYSIDSEKDEDLKTIHFVFQAYSNQVKTGNGYSQSVPISKRTESREKDISNKQESDNTIFDLQDKKQQENAMDENDVPNQDDGIKVLLSIFQRIYEELDDFEGGINNRHAVNKWLFFHRMMYEYRNAPFISILYNGIRSKIEYCSDEKNNKSAIWYAEKMFDAPLMEWGKKVELNPKVLEVQRLAKAIMEILSLPNKDRELVYYTSIGTLSYIFGEKKDAEGKVTREDNSNGFKPMIMSVSTMNDPKEGHLLQELLSGDSGSHRYWWNSVPSGNRRYYCIEPYIFVKSFTETGRMDDLSLWETYGDRAEGCCCKVEVREVEGEQGKMYRVAYLDSENRIVQMGGERDQTMIELLNLLLELLENSVKAAEDAQKKAEENDAIAFECRKGIMEIAYLFKEAAYSHENETRSLYSFVFENDIPYRNMMVKTVGSFQGKNKYPLLCVESKATFRFKEVILGPKVKNPDIVASYLIHQFGITDGTGTAPLVPAVTMSSIHYR